LPKPRAVAVERRDRFARFGAEEVEAALVALRADDDLVREATEILTRRWARRSGRRSAACRAAQATAALEPGEGDRARGSKER